MEIPRGVAVTKVTISDKGMEQNWNFWRGGGGGGDGYFLEQNGITVFQISPNSPKNAPLKSSLVSLKNIKSNFSGL